MNNLFDLPKNELFANWPAPQSVKGAPSTSREAAASVASHTSTIAQGIHALLVDEGPHTCAEVELKSGLSHQTCSARFTELKRKGLIRDTGQKRKTPSGRNAVVWAAVQQD